LCAGALEGAAQVAGWAVEQVVPEQAVGRAQVAPARAVQVPARVVRARVPVRVVQARVPEEEAFIIRKSEARGHPALRD
jgi:hypothetical protein